MFELPIELLDNKNSISETIQSDLQLDIVYNDLFGKQKVASSLRNKWLNTFTSNTEYLKETQDLLQNNVSDFPSNLEPLTVEIHELLNKMKTNPSFKEKYEYITVEFFEKLNHNEPMLQAISMYTLTSPILSLLTPVIMLFIPFFVLRVMGKSVTLQNYISELKRVFSMLPIGKIFELREASMDQRGLIIFSVILYFVQIYQNTLTCYKFYRNTKEMVKEIHKCGYYCNLSASSMEHFIRMTEDYDTYKPFGEVLKTESQHLRKIGKDFIAVKEETYKHMGKKMKLFYDLYSDPFYDERFKFCFEFSEYISNIRSLADINTLHVCNFSNKKTSFKNSYYSLLRYTEPVKNSYSLSKNAILSGPNASGKTTMLKSTMINIILSQQIGMGFYEFANIYPYDYLHCYINIPDSCNRDSLFQAEARRCKEILDIIHDNSNSRHLCVFDELFSGTNPYEAIGCAFGYLTHIHKYTNVQYMLTTHYLDLCKIMTKNKDKVTNYTLENKYHLKKGISKIKGGIDVIENMDFPVDIINSAKKLVS